MRSAVVPVAAVTALAAAVLVWQTSGRLTSPPARSPLRPFVYVRPVVPRGIALRLTARALERRLVSALGPGAYIDSVRVEANALTAGRAVPSLGSPAGTWATAAERSGPAWLVHLTGRFRPVTTLGAGPPDPPPLRRGFVIVLDRTGRTVAFGFGRPDPGS